MKITKVGLQAVLDGITFGPSGVMLDKMDLKWEVEEVLIGVKHNVFGSATGVAGWRIRFTFLRPDTVTGEMGRGTGRWELVDDDTSESAIVKTCWVLLELLVRHELMESFQYQGVKLFNPHRTVEELALPAKLGPPPPYETWGEYHRNRKESEP